jgi:NAD+ kinase
MPPLRLPSGPGAAPVGVLANPIGECEPQLRQIEAWARQFGLDVVDLGTSAAPRPPETACDLIVALGGDGTILRALQLAMEHHAAVLGVNFGTVGFLADIDGDELASALDRIAAGAAQVEERTALVAEIDGGDAGRLVAFNDVVVARRPGFGTARLHLTVADRPLLRLNGDGLVIASPTGSTAYNVGAGGPAVEPSLHAIVLTPLATQGSPLRSLVIEGSEVVRVEVDPASAPLRVEIDGRIVHDVPDGAGLAVCAAPRKARLVRTQPRTFYDDLSRRV